MGKKRKPVKINRGFATVSVASKVSVASVEKEVEARKAEAARKQAQLDADRAAAAEAAAAQVEQERQTAAAAAADSDVELVAVRALDEARRLLALNVANSVANRGPAPVGQVSLTDELEERLSQFVGPAIGIASVAEDLLAPPDASSLVCFLYTFFAPSAQRLLSSGSLDQPLPPTQLSIAQVGARLVVALEDKLEFKLAVIDQLLSFAFALPSLADLLLFACLWLPKCKLPFALSGHKEERVIRRPSADLRNPALEEDGGSESENTSTAIAPELTEDANSESISNPDPSSNVADPTIVPSVDPEPEPVQAPENKDDASDESDQGVSLDLFDNALADDAEGDDESSAAADDCFRISVGLPKQFRGATPRFLLEEYCRQHFGGQAPRFSHSGRPGLGFSASVAIVGKASRRRTIGMLEPDSDDSGAENESVDDSGLAENDGDDADGARRQKYGWRGLRAFTSAVCPTVKEAIDFVSTRALFVLNRRDPRPIHVRLPQPCRDLFLIWQADREKRLRRRVQRSNRAAVSLLCSLGNAPDCPDVKLSADPTSSQSNTDNNRTQQQQQRHALKTTVAAAAAQAYKRSVEQRSREQAEYVSSSLRSGPVNSRSRVPDPLPFMTTKELSKRRSATTSSRQLVQDRSQLPAAGLKDQFLDAVADHAVVICCGATGSGKTTQLPQMLVEHGIQERAPFNVVCCQPRRLTAVSVARRVSQELGDPDGVGGRRSLVGYSIRLESKQSAATRLLFCTTGVLLRRLQRDPLLSSVSHIVIDEVHERSWQQDFVLLLLRRLLRHRCRGSPSPLSLVLMSATVDSEQLSAYFSGCGLDNGAQWQSGPQSAPPVLTIPGRLFPVDAWFLEDVVELTGYAIDVDDSEYGRAGELAELDRASGSQVTMAVPARGGRQNKQTENIFAAGQDASSLGEAPGLDHDKYSKRTRRTMFRMDPKVINFELIELLLRELHRACDSSVPSDVPSLRADDGRLLAVLIFMPGLAEIRSLFEQLLAIAPFNDPARYLILPMHSSLVSAADQDRAFTWAPPGCCKIIISTNISETGVTFPDVGCVIDTGKHKELRFDEGSRVRQLVNAPCAQANVLQRRGRAGRVRPGCAFHLFSRRQFSSMRSHQVPEICRVPLEELCLHALVIGGNSSGATEDSCDPRVLLAEAMDPPDRRSVELALWDLISIGAVREDDSALVSHSTDRQTTLPAEPGGDRDYAEPSTSSSSPSSVVSLTHMGYQLSSLPLDARVGKMLLYSCLFSCLDPILTVAAAMTQSRSVFVSPLDKRDQADAARRRLAVGLSDQMTIVRVFQTWTVVRAESPSAEAAWCSRNFVHRQTLRTMALQRTDLYKLLCSAAGGLTGSDGRHAERGSDREKRSVRAPDLLGGGTWSTPARLNRHSDNFNVLRAVLLAGFDPHLAVVHEDGSVAVQRRNQRAEAGSGDDDSLHGGARGSLLDDEPSTLPPSTAGSARIHPSSVCAKRFHVPVAQRADVFGRAGPRSFRLAVYQSLEKTTRTWVRDISFVGPIAAALFSSGTVHLIPSRCLLCVGLRGCIRVQCRARTGAMMLGLRHLIGRAFQQAVSGAPDGHSSESRQLVDFVVSLLNNEG